LNIQEIVDHFRNNGFGWIPEESLRKMVVDVIEKYTPLVPPIHPLERRHPPPVSAKGTG